MKTLLHPIIACALLLCCFCAAGADFTGIERLLQRQLPLLHGKVAFREYRAAGSATADAFRIYAIGGNLTIEATSPSAAAAAVNHYIKRYCRSSISHCGNNINIPLPLPMPDDTITISTPFEKRYALNYCTYNYTYSFYTWSEWERELDWMALNGVNLMLAPIGTEAVWQQTLLRFGFSDREIKNFIPGTAYTAWWLMGNLEGWGGAVTDNMIAYAKDMQRKILRRMGELGITPVLQGFWGMVPATLQDRFPSAKVIPQGKWAGGFERPALLLPEDPLFAQMADAYYGYMKEYYGGAEFWGGDLFHEGGSVQGIDVTKTARLVQDNMLRHFPRSAWVLQGWGGNPKDALLAGLSKSNTLIIDLFGESQQNWRKRDEYGGFEWLWCSVNNFGGKMGMGAQLPTLVEEPHRALAFSRQRAAERTPAANNLLKGIGIIPEGIDANPVAFDFALQTAWSAGTPSVEDYLRNYVLYRYGSWNDSIYAAWQIMRGTIYGDYEHSGEGAYESILCARPSLNISSVSTWGPRVMQYDPYPLKRALRLMQSAKALYPNSETYRYDLTDLARQVTANDARIVYADIVKAFEAKDATALKRSSAAFIRLILKQDSLLSADSNFTLNKWLQQAQRYCRSVENADYDGKKAKSAEHTDVCALCERNARTLISYWGPDNPATNLHDYSHREWSGLLRTLYLQRWMAFFEDLQRQLQGMPAQKINYYGMERQWAETILGNTFQ